MKERYIERLVICIPVHGPSEALNNAIRSIDSHIRNVCESENLSCYLLIANSGDDIYIDKYWHGQYQVVDIPSNYYWGAAVKSLFIAAQKHDPTHVLLMNHDIVVEPDSFSKLIAFLPHFPHSVLSSVSITGYDQKVENAGFRYTNGTLPLDKPYFNASSNSLPERTYPVDLLNGRFVLFPAAAANPNFLIPTLVPHCFADTVLSARARRSGFPLIVVTSSKVYSDLSDTEFKRARQRCDTIQGLYNCLFKPYSYRYVWGNFWGQILLVDNFLLGIIASIKYTSGRIVKSLLELFRVLKPL